MEKRLLFLGSGFAHIYPAENKGYAERLFKRWSDCNRIFTREQTRKMHFPARNRLISGLSNGVLVVEAKEKSGTLITVDYALDQGKEVFIIPGNITNPNSNGTNSLIQQGAKLVYKSRRYFGRITFKKSKKKYVIIGSE